ncbi:helix-turn-helix domain-containing protein [Aestuariivirga sp.]|uniref:helix-turn-helix domain-containing protein n=1 Tax=Aestuariivirga sp. TaxID=2650926 RepID=UPI0039E2B56E
MENPEANLDHLIAGRLRQLRVGRGWSLDQLAQQSGVSRATLSRLENAEVSATANVLGRLCAVYGLTMSRLMFLAEETFTPLVRAETQSVWRDKQAGFTRRSVSPPAAKLSGEVIECWLEPLVRIAYAHPPRPGLEHHLVMVEGELILTIEGSLHTLRTGDCLRYRLFGESLFETGAVLARYFLFTV